jgi:hypothetical protein
VLLLGGVFDIAPSTLKILLLEMWDKHLRYVECPF